jgi:hypothetical protein
MLSIPQAEPTPESSDPTRENNVVLAEDSWTIGVLLSLVYPIDCEFSDEISFGKLANLLSVAEKYQIDYAAKQIENALLARVMLGAKEALQVYAIGSAFDNKRLIKEGSKGCLRASAAELFDVNDERPSTGKAKGSKGNTQIGNQVTGTGIGDENPPSINNVLRLMNGQDYHRLHMAHRQRSREAKALVSSLRDGPFQVFKYSGSNSSTSTCKACSLDIRERYVTLALAELDASGPTSKRIVSQDFLASCVSDRNCGDCCKLLLMWNLETFAKLKQKIDALPDSI